jgi:methylthioribose-1-phosphate isomerase
VANKIGTYTKAVLAHRHRIPFYVAIPLSTIDWKLDRGSRIPIEERHESEVLGAWGVIKDLTVGRRNGAISRSRSTVGGRAYLRVANPGSGAYNPGFDVTPGELITGIITPLGIFKPRELWAHRRQLGWRP